jgi:ABC-type nitrate/sulfonate/bicarbonate transport system permease component
VKPAILRAAPAGPRGQAFSARRGFTLRAGVVRLGVILLLLVFWQIAAHFGDKIIMAPPASVVTAIWAMLGDAGPMAALGQTLFELITAFAIAAVAGAAIGLLLGRNSLAHAAIFPVVLLLYSLPQAPLLPLFVLLFGIGPAGKIAFGVSHGIFPMIVTVAAGVREIDPALLQFARSSGARPHQVIWAIVLPSATASFFTGLRLTMAGVLLGVLLAELFVSQAGIGYFTQLFANAFQPAKLFALIALLAALAVTLNGICRAGENWFNRWRA